LSTRRVSSTLICAARAVYLYAMRRFALESAAKVAVFLELRAS
jgi:hypothetical protein